VKQKAVLTRGLVTLLLACAVLVSVLYLAYPSVPSIGTNVKTSVRTLLSTSTSYSANVYESITKFTSFSTTSSCVEKEEQERCGTRTSTVTVSASSTYTTTQVGQFVRTHYETQYHTQYHTELKPPYTFLGITSFWNAFLELARSVNFSVLIPSAIAVTLAIALYESRRRLDLAKIISRTRRLVMTSTQKASNLFLRLLSPARRVTVQVGRSLLAQLKRIANPKLRWEVSLLDAYQNERWAEALKIYHEHNLSSSSATQLIHLIEANMSKPTIVFVDVETDPSTERVWELGAVKTKGSAVLKDFHEFVRIDSQIPKTRLDAKEFAIYERAPSWERTKNGFLFFVGNASYIGGHNINFDIEHIADPTLSSKTLLDTLELGFLTWPTRFSHALSDLSGSEEKHRAVEDARTTYGLFRSILESLQNMSALRRAIVLAACRNSGVRQLLSELLGVPAPTHESIHTQLDSIVTAERQSMARRYRPRKFDQDDLSEELAKFSKPSESIMLVIDGAADTEDIIKSCFVHAADYGTTALLQSPYDLTSARIIASRMNGFECPIPQIAIGSRKLSKICPRNFSSSLRAFATRDEKWQHAFLAIALWLMDSPEGYVEEFSQWLRRDDDWINSLLIQLTEHDSRCPPECGFAKSVSPALLLCDVTTIPDSNSQIIVPFGHRLESVITDGETEELSSRQIREFLQASSAGVTDENALDQIKKSDTLLTELISAIVKFARNRDLRIDHDPDRSTVRILHFYLKSSDWGEVSKLSSDLVKALFELAPVLERTDWKSLSGRAKRIADSLTLLSKDMPADRVRWFTLQRDEAEFEWTHRHAPVDVTTASKRLVEQDHIILVTESVSHEKIVEFLSNRWGVSGIRIHHVKSRHRSKIICLSFLPRPSHLNVPSFLSTLAALAVPLAKLLHGVEFSINNRIIANVFSRVLRKASPNIAVVSRSHILSRRRAITRASYLASKEAPFALIDQTFLIRKKERRVHTDLVFLERLPLPSVADPVSAARLEAAGSGIDALEGYVLPQAAITLTEIASYAGTNANLPLVVCDTRFKSLGAALTGLLDKPPQWCDSPSDLASALSLPEDTLSMFDESAKSMAEIVKHAMREEGLDRESDFSKIIDPTTYLRAIFGHDSFRESQEDIIRRILRKQDTFVVMPTGYGKSLCFQIPAIVFSLMEEGLTLILTPLQALMRDQVQSLHRQGIFRATYVNASLTPIERSQRLRGIRYGWYNLVYLAPEQLRNSQTLEAIRSREISLMVIDEAHCLSQWGHDFRPDYMFTADFLNKLPNRPIVTAFTATATEQVAFDAKRVLGIQTDPVRLSPRRKNIELKAIKVNAKSWQDAEAKKREVLIETLKDLRGQNGIIYCAFTRTTEEIAFFLKDHSNEIGRSADEIAFFHGKIPDQDKLEIQDRFIGKTKQATQPIKLVVATNAFGLGIDKEDIHFIVHYDIPGSLESYYQEVGRAGRDIRLEAQGILIFAETDLDKQRLLFRFVDEKDIAHLHEILLKMRPSPDGTVYVSDTDLARDTGLDDVTVRVALYQLEKHKFLQRGPNAFSPAVLKLQHRSKTLTRASNPDSENILQYLVNHLSETEWRTIYPEKAASELNWDPRRVDIALRLLLREKDSGIVKRREFEITFGQPRAAKEETESIYREQLRLKDELSSIFPELDGGEWISIRGESWPRLVRALRPSGKLSRVECAKYLRIWANLRLMWYKQELSRDSLRLTVSPNRFKTTLEECEELDLRLVEFLVPKSGKRTSVDTESLAQLGASTDEIDDSLRRLAELGILDIARCATTSATCMSLKLLSTDAVTPSDLDLAALKKFQRDREHKLELMSKYATLTTDEDRWHLIEDYFAGRINREVRSDIISGLNMQQIEAVTAPAGYLLINAGAGTGKTETVARRILYVSEELAIPSGQILAMTFSRSGVAQLRERMRRVMPNRRIDIRTYHSLCYEILRSHAGEEPLWIKPGFDVESTESLMGRIRQTLETLRDGLLLEERVGAYSKAIQKLLSLREPLLPQDIKSDFELEIDKKKLDGLSLRKVYSAYLDLLKKSNTIDYSLMISLTVDLLRTRPEVVRDYERRVAYLVVDEYQDTTPIQDELLSLLSGWYRNLCVVGDSDQTIFAWSNADIRNILDFRERRPDARQINLEINYRSTQNILDVANECIEHNEERIPKRLTSARNVNGTRVMIHYCDDSDELGANFICEGIKEKLAGGTHLENIAVLTKTNDQLAKLLETMRSRGIPANTPVQEYLAVRNAKVQQILSALEKTAEEKPQLSAYSAYANLLKTTRGIPEGFDDFVREFDQNAEDNSLLAFLNLVKATTSQDSRLSRKSAVNLMTIHKAKGLEFGTVFVTYLRAGSFPRFNVKAEEERRVFYVGLTRAKDELIVVAPRSRISQFIREIAATESSIHEDGDVAYVREARTQKRPPVHRGVVGPPRSERRFLTAPRAKDVSGSQDVRHDTYDRKFCRYCGADASLSSKYCKTCGRHLGGTRDRTSYSEDEKRMWEQYRESSDYQCVHGYSLDKTCPYCDKGYPPPGAKR
jgi:RecQ family ATP-dependent DNA helicase